MRYFFLWCLLAGCSLQNRQAEEAQPIVRQLSEVKQKQRLVFLQKKLQSAEQAELQAELWVKQLKKEIQIAKLALIRKQVDDYERQLENRETGSLKEDLFMKNKETLFMKEREELYALIQSDADPNAVALLDRILRLITELSDDREKQVGRIGVF